MNWYQYSTHSTINRTKWVLINNSVINRLKTNNKRDNLRTIYSGNISSLKHIKDKLEMHKADKGNTFVIMKTDHYNHKAYEFFSDKEIKQIKIVPTKIYVKELNNTINKCTTLFNEAMRPSLKLSTPPHHNSLNCQRFTNEIFPFDHY